MVQGLAVARELHSQNNNAASDEDTSAPATGKVDSTRAPAGVVPLPELYDVSDDENDESEEDITIKRPLAKISVAEKAKESAPAPTSSEGLESTGLAAVKPRVFASRFFDVSDDSDTETDDCPVADTNSPAAASSPLVADSTFRDPDDGRDFPMVPVGDSRPSAAASEDSTADTNGSIDVNTSKGRKIIAFNMWGELSSSSSSEAEGDED